MNERERHGFALAVWLVIASEALLFAGLFALYAAYRAEYPAEFRAGVAENVTWIGGLNTMVLLTSSFAMALAIVAIRDRRRPKAALAIVLALGSIFLILKAVEWTGHVQHGIVPGAAGSLPLRGHALFFTLYYFMTGLHAAHVIAGLGLVAWIFARVRRRHPTTVAAELVGVYWHFVDLIWVFLWPLFYLLR
jgi:cytochrome c oxidase subunit 3